MQEPFEGRADRPKTKNDNGNISNERREQWKTKTKNDTTHGFEDHADIVAKPEQEIRNKDSVELNSVDPLYAANGRLPTSERQHQEIIETDEAKRKDPYYAGSSSTVSEKAENPTGLTPHPRNFCDPYVKNPL
jgi:hypothetical protein